MNPALNREASEARMADLRHRAGRDAITLADMRAANREAASLAAPAITAMLRLLLPRRIRRTPQRVIAADIDSVGTGVRLLSRHQSRDQSNAKDGAAITDPDGQEDTADRRSRLGRPRPAATTGESALLERP